MNIPSPDTLLATVRKIAAGVGTFSRAQDELRRVAAPVAAAIAARFVQRRPSLASQAALFGAGFVAGAVSTALLTPMKGKELRGLIASRARPAWGSLSERVGGTLGLRHHAPNSNGSDRHSGAGNGGSIDTTPDARIHHWRS